MAPIGQGAGGAGIDSKQDEESFIGTVFAAKFNYISDSPGYGGDLFVLIGRETGMPADDGDRTPTIEELQERIEKLEEDSD